MKKLLTLTIFIICLGGIFAQSTIERKVIGTYVQSGQTSKYKISQSLGEPIATKSATLSNKKVIQGFQQPCDDCIIPPPKCEDVAIEYVITPNGDNKNDVWVLKGLENANNISVSVYSRWGQQVFNRPAYLNDWNGVSDESGEPLPYGTYYYVLQVDGQDQPCKGTIVILY